MAASSRLFDSVCFYILEDHMEAEGKEDLVYKVRRTLLQGGGIEETFISGLVTHVIADVHVEDREDVLGDDCTASIIHSKWVLLSNECHVLLPLAPFEMHTGKLFYGVHASSTGIHKSDRDKLCALVLYYGGRFHSYLDENSTHLIATKPEGEKHKAALKHNLKVVQPEWVLDCIKYNKRLSELDYPVEEREDEQGLIVETMSVTRTSTIPSDYQETNGGKRIKLDPDTDKGRLTTAIKVEEASEDHSSNSASVVESSVPMEEQEPVSVHMEEQEPVCNRYEVLERVLLKNSESPASSFPPDKDSIASTPQPVRAKDSRSLSKGKEIKKDEETLLQGMVFAIIDYPELLDNVTISKWKEVIRQHGGETLDQYDPTRCTHLLSQNKCSKTFVQACCDSVCISSAHWLNDVLSEQKMFPPRNPLHYPVAFKEMPGWCQGLSLSITNYVGTERDLVRDMIRMVGTPYTGYLSRTATHLVCKRPEGRKYDKALEWGVKVVNPVFISDIMHSEPNLRGKEMILNNPDPAYNNWLGSITYMYM